MFGRKKQKVESNGLHFTLQTPDDAKRAIAELKLKKKEFQLRKREISAAMAQLRAERRTQVARQGSKFRGRGGLARAIRGAQTAGRDNDRREYTNRLNALEAQKLRIDADIAQIDGAVIQAQRWLDEAKRELKQG